MNNVRSISQRLRATLLRAVRRAREAIRAASRALENHVDRMLNDPGYSMAFRDLVLAAVDLLVPRPVARYMADQILTIYLAILRLFKPPRDLGPDWI